MPRDLETWEKMMCSGESQVVLNSRFAGGRFLGADDLSFISSYTRFTYVHVVASSTFLQDKHISSRVHAKFDL
jgi:hypothetical protein